MKFCVKVLFLFIMLAGVIYLSVSIWLLCSFSETMNRALFSSDPSTLPAVEKSLNFRVDSEIRDYYSLDLHESIHWFPGWISHDFRHAKFTIYYNYKCTGRNSITGDTLQTHLFWNKISVEMIRSGLSWTVITVDNRME